MFLEKINAAVWGWGLLGILLATGIFYTVKLGFIQFRLFPFILRSFTPQKGSAEKNVKGISQFRTVCASLGTAMGTGNIIGVTTALAIGGAGAVFWMWASAFLGMAIVYAENYLSIHFRKNSGGPMDYIENGLGSRKLAVMFSVFCVMASFGMGGMVQANSISNSVRTVSAINPFIIGIIIFGAVLIVISGGIKRISSASQILIPILTAIYISVSVIVIVKYKNRLPDVFREIFSQAFNFRSATGGVAAQALSIGIRRGIFSNEAGLGSLPIMHGAASDSCPETLGMWSVFEVFLDTVVCCTLTALVLLSTASASVNSAFSCVFGKETDLFVAVSITLFAFCTVIGWYYCGETAVKYIFKGRFIEIFRLSFAGATATGAVLALNSVWTLSDIFNGLMALPNLIALIFLSKFVSKNKKIKMRS